MLPEIKGDRKIVKKRGGNGLAFRQWVLRIALVMGLALTIAGSVGAKSPVTAKPHARMVADGTGPNDPPPLVTHPNS